jgi:beta-lactamase superfamily II metal-dependent hydrolase
LGLEIEFLPTGDDSGDAILIREGMALTGFTIHSVDGGYASTSETIIEHIEQYYGKDVSIDHMVLSHADDDHATGLIKVLERFHVTNLWMNRPWLFVDEVIQHFHGNYTRDGLYRDMRDLHPYLIRLEEIVAKKNRQSLFQTVIREVFQGSQIGSFLVLAPSRERYLRLIPELPKTPKSYAADSAANTLLGGLFTEAKKKVETYLDERWNIETLSSNPQPPTNASNETSVVQLGRVGTRTILLTADAGPDALNDAADYALACGLLAPPTFVQVPHHGSRHNVTPEVLDRWLGTRVAEGVERGTAYVSVGKKRLGHPRGQVSNAFLRRGYPVHIMRTAAKRYSFDMDERGWEKSILEPFKNEVEA